MVIKPMEREHTAAVHQLWNQAAASPDIIHKPLTVDQFEAKFMTAGVQELKVNLVHEQDNQVVGFGNAYHKLGSDIGYITFVLVAPHMRRRGIGGEILAALEAKLQERSSITRIHINYFNPINLEWIIPNTPGHDHPNAPGVDIETAAFPFFQKHGYKETSEQYSYYRPLQDFQLEPNMAERVENLKRDDITVTYYDPQKHYGFEELFVNLGNDDWREKIMTNLQSPNPYPVLVVEQRGRIGGFTGPLYVQTSGRGYFAGIGIHSDYRLHGGGSVLFSCLCQGLKDEGAAFMSLFTGTTNVARRIYESAGFVVVHEWACMQKELHG